MKPPTLRRIHKAFTIIELLVVLVIIGVLAALLFPDFNRRHLRAHSSVCMNNLRQVGLGLKMYSSDHRDQFPWQMPTNAPAATSLLESRAASEYFLVLSNYALSSQILVCPTDKARSATTSYSRLNNTNLSYFAALSTTPVTGSNAWQLILSGDRNLSVDGQAAKSGFCALNDKSVPGWTLELHNTRGCLLFVDGHVQFVPAKNMPRIFGDQPLTPTRLSIP